MDDGGSIDDGDGTVPDPLAGSMSGRLLVATPQLRDPRFARTVVLLLDHDESGTVGVVLNQPLDLAVSAEFPSWGECSALAAPEVFFSGGPVEIDGALVLAALRPGVVAPIVRAVPGSIAVIDIDSEPAEAPYWASGLRVFAGYSGWGPGRARRGVLVRRRQPAGGPARPAPGGPVALGAPAPTGRRRARVHLDRRPRPQLTTAAGRPTLGR